MWPSVLRTSSFCFSTSISPRRMLPSSGSCSGQHAHQLVSVTFFSACTPLAYVLETPHICNSTRLLLPFQDEVATARVRQRSRRGAIEGELNSLRGLRHLDDHVG